MKLFEIYYEIVIHFAKLLRIHFLFKDFTMSSLGVWRIYYEFTIYSSTSLWIYLMFRKFTMISLFISWILVVLRINYPFREFAIYLLSLSRIHQESLVFRLLTINSLLNREIIMNSVFVPRIHYILGLFTMKSLSLPWIHYIFREFIYFGNSP